MAHFDKPSAQLSVSNEMMLEQYLGELDEFLKLETIAQTELQGLKEGARRYRARICLIKTGEKPFHLLIQSNYKSIVKEFILAC